jgi:hypothetical protein
MTRKSLAVRVALSLAVLSIGAVTGPTTAATHKSCRWLHPVGKPRVLLCVVVKK